MEIKTAKITSTKLGYEDHGILTFMIYVETDYYSVGIGGYALDRKDRKDATVYNRKTGELIAHILNTVEVENWEDLKGKYIRFKDMGHNQTIYEIGNIIKDKWFNMKEFFGGED